MARRSYIRTSLKWLGTLLCLLIFFAFVYSTRHGLSWTSPELDQHGVAYGAVWFSWIRDDAPVTEWEYAPSPGWDHYINGSPSVFWWPEIGNSSLWWVIGIPLWMPFLIVAAPTALMWFWDRKDTARTFRGFLDWLTPKHPKRVNGRLILLFCVLHVVAVVACNYVTTTTYEFFMYGHRYGWGFDVIQIVFPVLFVSTPLWAWLWAWLWTRFRNALFRRQSSENCQSCGYNLTGNVTGRCPECGENVETKTGQSPAI